MSFSLGYLVGSLLIAVTFLYGKSVLAVLAIRFRTKAPRERVERSDVPAEVAELLERESPQLEALGFEPLAFVRAPDAVVGSAHAYWSRVFQHPTEKSFAVLHPSLAPSRTRRCETLFLAQADAGRWLQTTAFEVDELHAGCPKHVFVAAGSRELAEQWARHQREVAERPDFAPRDVSVDELLVESSQAFECMIRRGLDSGRLTPAGEGIVRFSTRAAIAAVFKRVRRSLRGRGAAAKGAPAQGPAASSEAGPGDVTAEVWEHKRRESVSAASSHGWLVKLALFAASMAAMMVAFGLTFSLETGVILLAVLLVHESGHALAMKLFGYRNLQMLFIPLFGAVASGHKRGVKPWQELVVLLAGPLPGIAVGLLLLVLGPANPPPWLDTTTSVLLLLNYFNLLPIFPLDGGQIMNLVLFERFPRAQVVFSALSAVALILWSGGRVIFLVGVVMLLALPAQLKLARLLNRARAKLVGGDSPDSADPLPLLYTELRNEKMTADAKFALVKQLVERLARQPAGAGLACASIVGWLVLMSLPLGLIGYSPLAGRDSDAELAAKWGGKIAAAKTPQDEIRARVAAADALAERFDFGEARKLLEPALPRLKALREPELEASALLSMARIEEAALEGAKPGADALARARRDLDRALDLREQRFGAESLEVAEVLEAFPRDAGADPVGALVRELRLISIYEATLPQHPDERGSLVRAYADEAMLRERVEDHERAELALQRGLALADAASPEERAQLQRQALGQLVGFYFARERYDDLRALLAQRAALVAETSDAADGCWVDYWSGAGDAAGCFAALRREAAGHGGARGVEMLAVEYALGEAVSKQRAGDAAGAQAALGAAREVFGSRSGLEQAFELYLRARTLMPGPDDFAGREYNRRSAELKRLLAPSPGPVAAAS